MVEHIPGFPRFTLEPGKMGGQACVRGYRFGLQQLLDMIDNGLSPERIMEKFSFLEREDIDDAIRYAIHEAKSSYYVNLSA